MSKPPEVLYAQCWEDADILLEALDIQEGDRCLSIASAGDNTLSLLTRNPAHVLAVDVNPAQLRCLALRVAAYRSLTHPQLLQLIGSRACEDRLRLYSACRAALGEEDRRFWDGHPDWIHPGIGTIGKFESYFRLFRRRVLPLVHSQRRVDELLAPRSREGRAEFYAGRWDTWRWRLLFRIFFSRTLMGRLGRRKEFFRYVDAPVSERILERTRYALVELDPHRNPYVEWILTERHGESLPHALREESFEPIRRNLDRLEWRLCSLSDAVRAPGPAFDRFNLSDAFEYLSPAAFEELLEALAQRSRPGGRLVYWNMLAPRSRPERMAHLLRPLRAEAERLHAADKAFFYSRLVIEERLP